jgi:alkanesulfonate monooxygenase SsuD/methylene tetrahydromethanopterin reductase-like flavin-dependent oxidoreductase (luciferase family)
MMRFSVWPINQQPLADVLDVAEHAAATGWDGVWMSDHLLPAGPPPDQPVVECWTAMTAIAARVPRVRVGSLVLSNTFRRPAVVAKMVATFDELAPGRLVLGLGAGWQANEHVAFDIPLAPPAERLRDLAAACVSIRSLLDTGRTPDGATVVAPVPAARIPLLLGLKGDHALGLVAEHADEWNLWAGPDRLRERSEVLARHCDRVDRDPSTISRTAQAVVAFTEAGEPVDARWERAGLPIVAGTAEQMREQVAAYRDAGLDELVVPDFALGRGTRRIDALDRFITEVAGAFR